MNINKQKLIRFSIILLGIILLMYSLNIFFKSLFPVIINFLKGNIKNINLIFENNNNNKIYIIFIFSIILLYVGIIWKNIFKNLSIILCSIAIFFIIMTIFMFIINSNAENITNSIQPSIDRVVATSLEKVLENQINNNNKFKNFEEENKFKSNSENIKIKLLFYINPKIIKIENDNLNQTNLEILNSIFNLKKFSKENKKKISEIIISEIYNNMIESKQLSPETAIEPKILKEIIKKKGVDLNSISNSEIEYYYMFTKIEKQAYINLIISENQEIETINPKKLNNKIVNKIWKELELNNNISYETKYKFISIFLNQIGKLNLDFLDTPIPIKNFKDNLPNEIKPLLNYDLFNKNITKRIKEINQIRNDCDDNIINNENICKIISLSKYENIILNLQNFSKNKENLGIDLTKLENYNNLNKVEKKLLKVGNYWKKYLIFFILFNIFAGISYLIHIKYIYKNEPHKYEILYFISKQNLINIIFFFIVIIIIFYIIISNKIIELINIIIDKNIGLELINIEIYKIFQNIITTMFYSMSILFFISIIITIILFLLQKKELNKIKILNNVKC